MDGAMIQIAGVVGLFFLRLIVPLTIMFAVGYWLRRLDAKWQAEAEARQKTAQRGQPVALQSLPLAADDVGQLIRERCWDLRRCASTKRAQCPAFAQPDVLCWQAREQAEGQLPAKCSGCELYAQDHQEQSSVRH